MRILLTLFLFTVVHAQAQFPIVYSTPGNDFAGTIIRVGDSSYVMAFQDNNVSNTTGNSRVRKVDLQGNLLWEETFGGSGSDRYTTIIEYNGDLFLNGLTRTYTTDSYTSTNHYSCGRIYKLDETGNEIWSKSYGGTSYGENYGGPISFDSNGDLFVWGHIQHHAGCSGYTRFFRHMDQAGNILNSDCYLSVGDGPQNIEKLVGTDEFIVTGKQSAGSLQMWYAKFDNSSNLVWQLNYGPGDVSNNIFDVKALPNGGFLMAGNCSGTGFNGLAGYIAKFDSNGILVWEEFFDPTANDDYLFKVDILPNGNIIATGRQDSATQDGWVLETDASGIEVASYVYGSPLYNDYPRNFCFTPDSSEIIVSSIITPNGDVDALFERKPLPSSVDTCLVASYPFNGNANDESVWANHGTVNGATLTTDRFGNTNSAYSFDGVDDHIIIPHSSQIDFSNTDDFAYSFWFQTSSASESRVFQKRDFNTGYEIITLGDSLTVYYDDGTNPQVWEGGTNTIVTDGDWFHAVVVFDNSIGEIRTYINGDYENNPIDISGELNIQNSLDLLIGANPALTSVWDGKIDDIKIFGCALSPNQIDSIYQSEAPAIPCGITGTTVITEPTCHDGNDGSIDLEVNGGQQPYSFQWNNGATTEDISALQPGIYTVLVSDAAGCDTTVTALVGNPPNMLLNLNKVDATCGNADGSATVAVINGGTAPFSYSFTNGDTLATADSLSAGMYMVTVTDANGCSNSRTFAITSSNGPAVSAAINEPSCAGEDDGGIDITVTGGQTPYDYAWSNGASTEDVSQVQTGIYDVTITDANNCVASATIDLTEPDPISIANANLTDPSCGNNDGEITVLATGGTGTLTYQWGANASNQTGQTATGLGAGAYYVQITDGNGCSMQQGIMLSNTSSPQVAIQNVYPAQCNGALGGVDVIITGGQPPFQFNWSNGATTLDLSAVPAGAYDLEVTDANGCTAMLSATVPGQEPLMQEICLVSVDSITATNLVVWEKPSPANGIHHFNIYKEGNAANVYELQDTVHYNNLSQWTDPIANPTIRAFRYKISVTDSCGNESQLSPLHKTVHLSTNLGQGNVFNLAWDNYIGFSFPSWYIERYHPSTGWVRIDTIPSNLFSYTDANPPSQGQNVQYSVSGEPSTPCVSTRAVSHNTTRSNRQSTGIFTGIHSDPFVTLGLYPNPTDGVIVIKGNLSHAKDYNLSITDLQGRRVMDMGNGSGTYLYQEINVGSLESGVYFLSIQGDDFERTVKFIKE